MKIVVTSRFGQKWECSVDMSEYAGVKAEPMAADLPENAVQMLKDDGIF